MSLVERRPFRTLLQERLKQPNAVSLPASTGGLNTRDNQANMEATDALVMTNVISSYGYLETRQGYTEFANDLTDNVETILEYSSGSTRKMVATAGINVYESSTGTSSLLGTGFSSARWQGQNFRGTLVMVNGSDAPQGYDGSTLSALTISGSGLVTSTLKGVTSHKNRLWWWDGASLDIWYGAIDTIGGALTKFQLSSIAQFGGYVLSMNTWSIDGGDGIDDYLVIFLSQGDVLIYSGTDPATNFALIGTYKVSVPIAQRAIIELGGDIVFVNDFDFTFFSKVFKETGLLTQLSKISKSINDATINYGSNFGWQVLYYAKRGWIIINVPKSTNNSYEQYVINTPTSSAFKIEGWDALTFGTYAGDLYFGGSGGYIYKADNGFLDGDDSINVEFQQAFSNFDNGQPKSINYFVPRIKLDGNVTLENSIEFDFGLINVSSPVAIESEGLEWDTFYWDQEYWSPESTIQNKRYTAYGQGVYISYGFKVSLKGQIVTFYGVDYSLTLNNL